MTDTTQIRIARAVKDIELQRELLGVFRTECTKRELVEKLLSGLLKRINAGIECVILSDSEDEAFVLYGSGRRLRLSLDPKAGPLQILKRITAAL